MQFCSNTDCNKPLLGKYQKKFCGHSCSAVCRNTGRLQTASTKEKIAESLASTRQSSQIRPTKRRPRIEVPAGICQKCEAASIASKHSMLCVKCRKQSNGGAHWFKYERQVRELLKEEFGELDKERLDGSFFDFCNPSVVIEFTFDSTRGVQNLTRRFRALSEGQTQGRRKIAFFPFKNVGTKRLARLKESGVEVRDSTPYKVQIGYNY